MAAVRGALVDERDKLEQVLQRTRLHSGQHLRQLYAFLGWLGVTPDEPLGDDELRKMGLVDLPDELF